MYPGQTLLRGSIRNVCHTGMGELVFQPEIQSQNWIVLPLSGEVLEFEVYGWGFGLLNRFNLKSMLEMIPHGPQNHDVQASK